MKRLDEDREAFGEIVDRLLTEIPDHTIQHDYYIWEKYNQVGENPWSDEMERRGLLVKRAPTLRLVK